jgi:hypothetical protein
MITCNIPSDTFVARNKNMYGLGVGISTVLEIVGHFLFKGGWGHPV